MFFTQQLVKILKHSLNDKTPFFTLKGRNQEDGENWLRTNTIDNTILTDHNLESYAFRSFVHLDLQSSSSVPQLRIIVSTY
uniref:Uncharacterized protein n=1 Tax=Cucumis melo TaxID=3656 RepID=A0A9I9EDP2_CUCME